VPNTATNNNDLRIIFPFNMKCNKIKTKFYGLYKAIAVPTFEMDEKPSF
jgi:hypothetical protein